MRENIRYVTTVERGGNLKYVLTEISNFYDINTKKSYNEEKFLNNFVGLLLEKFAINKVNIYIDDDVFEDNDQTYAYHFNGEIYLNKYFFKKRDNFFQDILTLSHEFMHLVQDHNLQFFVKNVGKNNGRFIYHFNDQNAINLGFTNYEDFRCLYITNENEKLAEEFAFKYVVKLIKEAKKIVKQDSIELALLNIQEEKILNQYLAQLKVVEKVEKNVLPMLIEKTKAKQEEWLTDFMNYSKENLPLYNSFSENEKSAFVYTLLNKKVNILHTFSIYENWDLFNKLKNFTFEESFNNNIFPMLYINTINFPNYVIQKQDIENLLKIFDSKNYSFSLNEIFLDQLDLMKNIMEIKFGNYNNKFDKIFDSITNKDYKSLLNKYSSFTNNLKNQNDEEY